jgi:hypothetical protein
MRPWCTKTNEINVHLCFAEFVVVYERLEAVEYGATQLKRLLFGRHRLQQNQDR